MDILALLMRFTHIASMSFLLGGALYARFLLLPATAGVAGAQQVLDRLAARSRGWIIGAVVAATGAGLYNLLNKAVTPQGYHMVFGIKFLLALHVMAVLILQTRPGIAVEKRMRSLTGVAVSGLLIVALSAYLRSLR